MVKNPFKRKYQYAKRSEEPSFGSRSFDSKCYVPCLALLPFSHLTVDFLPLQSPTQKR